MIGGETGGQDDENTDDEIEMEMGRSDGLDGKSRDDEDSTYGTAKEGGLVERYSTVVQIEAEEHTDCGVVDDVDVVIFKGGTCSREAQGRGRGAVR